MNGRPLLHPSLPLHRHQIILLRIDVARGCRCTRTARVIRIPSNVAQLLLQALCKNALECAISVEKNSTLSVEGAENATTPTSAPPPHSPAAKILATPMLHGDGDTRCEQFAQGCYVAVRDTSTVNKSDALPKNGLSSCVNHRLLYLPCHTPYSSCTCTTYGFSDTVLG